MTLDTSIPNTPSNNNAERDPVREFKKLVYEKKGLEALRLFREEYSLEEQILVKKNAPDYLRAAKFQGV